MNIIDNVYGEFEIEEKVLVELINSKAIQRLKGVSQQGVPLKYNHQPYFSRYEHSIGVMLLLRLLGASLKEQIAGLLHDVSHPAFSHLIDWVIGDPKSQEHQDSHFVDVLNSSDIPFILEKHGFDKEDFYNLDNYSLLETPAPDLCADRIDYTLRDIVAHGGKVITEEIHKHLINNERIIVFDSLPAAHAFAQEYKSLQFHNWCDDRNNSMYQIFADALRTAIDKGIIDKNNFFDDEEIILNRLESSNDKKILNLLELLKKGFKLDYSKKGFEIKGKFRFIDPKILADGKVERLSKLIPSYKYQLDLHKKHFNHPRFVEVSAR